MYEESNKVKEALKDELEGRKSDLEAAVNNLVDNYNELKLQLREYEEMNEASIILAQKLRDENEELKAKLDKYALEIVSLRGEKLQYKG